MSAGPAHAPRQTAGPGGGTRSARHSPLPPLRSGAQRPAGPQRRPPAVPAPSLTASPRGARHVPTPGTEPARGREGLRQQSRLGAASPMAPPAPLPRGGPPPPPGSGAERGAEGGRDHQLPRSAARQYLTAGRKGRPARRPAGPPPCPAPLRSAPLGRSTRQPLRAFKQRALRALAPPPGGGTTGPGMLRAGRGGRLGASSTPVRRPRPAPSLGFAVSRGSGVRLGGQTDGEIVEVRGSPSCWVPGVLPEPALSFETELGRSGCKEGVFVGQVLGKGVLRGPDVKG